MNPTMSATALTERGESPWSVVEERLENPERPRTYWLATVRPNGAPHLMPVIGMWLDGALHLVIGPGTRKGRNLATEPRCVVATGSTTLPHKYSTRLGTVGLLELTPERVHAEVIRLGELPGLRNPAHVGHIDIDRKGVLSASYDGTPIELVDGKIIWPGKYGTTDQF